VLTLVLGGARSGKSAVAEQLALDRGARCTYVATAVVAPDDPDFAERVQAHRERRPATWATVDAGAALASALRAVEGPVLVDSLGTWVAATPGFDVDIAELVAALVARAAETVVVSDEVGLGVHPPTDVGVRFRDVVGDVNRAVAEVADEVLLVVAGRVLPLERR
jgi:adenosyl cobinamide kinase/adenosyl cobinamide phosphate guanylyltransferase